MTVKELMTKLSELPENDKVYIGDMIPFSEATGFVGYDLEEIEDAKTVEEGVYLSTY